MGSEYDRFDAAPMGTATLELGEFQSGAEERNSGGPSREGETWDEPEQSNEEGNHEGITAVTAPEKMTWPIVDKTRQSQAEGNANPHEVRTHAHDDSTHRGGVSFPLATRGLVQTDI